jgi:zinc finger SWIM domain-containing protein 3
LNAHQSKFQFTAKYCDVRRYSIICNGKSVENGSPYPWRLNVYVPRHSVFYTITRMDVNEDHTCTGLFHGKYSQAPTRFFAKQFMGKLRHQPSYRPSDMQEDIQRELHITVPYKYVLDAKEHTVKSLNGTDVESFNYFLDIVNKSTNSTAIIKHTVDNKFRRLFIAYGASGVGFGFCRPILVSMVLI